MSGFNEPAGHGSAANNLNNLNQNITSPADVVREARDLLNVARRDWENQTDEDANRNEVVRITNEYRDALLQMRNTLEFHLQLVGVMEGGKGKTKKKARKTRRR